MRHDWILEVLADLQAYAVQNDLPGVARKAEEAMAEFRREVGGAADAAALPPPFGSRRIN